MLPYQGQLVLRLAVVWGCRIDHPLLLARTQLDRPQLVELRADEGEA